MLSEKPWKLEPILRLGLSIFICQFLGMVAMAVAGFVSGDVMERPWLFYGLVVGCAIVSAAALFVLRKPWDLHLFTRRFVTVLVCLYLGLTLGALAQHVAGKASFDNPTWRTVIAALSFQGVAIVFIGRFVREHGMRWAEAFGLNARWQAALLFGVLAACIFLPIGWALQNASAEIMSRAHLKTEIQPAVQALISSVTWLDRVAIGVVAIGLAPVGEELLFRGILYPAVKQAGYPRVAFWGTSLLFAAIHWNLLNFIPLLLLAVALTWLYEKTNNLLAPVAAHVLFNALNFFTFFFPAGINQLRQALSRFLPF